MPGESELRIKHTTVGAEEAARKTDAITEAQANLNSGLKELANSWAAVSQESSRANDILQDLLGKYGGQVAQLQALNKELPDLQVFTEQASDASDAAAFAALQYAAASETSAQALESAAQSQGRLVEATRPYIGLLSRIHPMLGAFAQSAFHAARIANDLATANLSLRGAFNAAATAMRNFSGAIKLTLAGGAVAAAFWAISKALGSIREEEERVAEAMRRTGDAATEQQKRFSDLRDQITKTSDARLRFGALTAEGAEQAAQQAQRVARKAGVSIETAGDVVGQLAGAGLSEQDLVDAARLRAAGRLREFDRREGPASRAAAVAVEQSRSAEFLEVQRQRQVDQSRRNAGRALTESRAEGGSVSELAGFLGDLPGQALGGLEPEDAARLIQQRVGGEKLSREDRPIVDSLIRLIERMAREGRSNVGVQYNFGQDAASMRARERNGSTEAELLEVN